ncbi:hypothetical protein JM83_0717 [Gillisia sp. Hel_I_86]|uniref:hypothetical protein n=1 Tax=Gillisia sp. Hel_I_86 TaxID=1249981 RepID=UPI00119C3A75|nr:hypothetical protein [Gillisia sp. Hel_I_86]TVZ25787.1 hypothetical protein JM83_0717 [Gillisia sp. Hel_I_86]
MQNFNLDVILDDVKNLISYSITNKDVDNSKFESLHKAIIQRYFDAKNIRIDYIDQTVDLKLPVSKNKFTPITFECLDLESFIISCIKTDEKSLYFYQNLLTHYNIVSAA